MMSTDQLTILEELQPCNRNVYKRLITYHCYREGAHDLPTKLVAHLNKVYGTSFITKATVKKLYDRFDQDAFDVNDLFVFERKKKKKKKKKSPPLPNSEHKALSEKNDGGIEPTNKELNGDEELKADGRPDDPETNGDDESEAQKKRLLDENDISGASSDENDDDDKEGEEGSSKQIKNKENRKKKLRPLLILPDTSALQGKKNLRRRQLILHCYEAKYSATEAARYLNSVYGENFCTKTSVCGWYRKFKQKDFSLTDKPRSGRRAAMDDSKLAEFMEQNPKMVVPKLCEHFGVHRKTMIRSLVRLGYRFVTDHWTRPVDKQEVTDKQLCEYKLQNPAASVRDMAEHFQVNRAIVARRLRSLGFNIPKWPTWPKKKKGGGGGGGAGSGGEGGEGEGASTGPTGTGTPRMAWDPERFIRRKTPKKPKNAQQQQQQQSQSQPQQPINQQSQNSQSFQDAHVIATMMNSDGNSGPMPPNYLQQQGVIQVDPNHQQPQNSQQFNNIIQLATTTAVNSILPAVLRHKSNPTTTLLSLSGGDSSGPTNQQQQSQLTNLQSASSPDTLSVTEAATTLISLQPPQQQTLTPSQQTNVIVVPQTSQSLSGLASSIVTSQPSSQAVQAAAYQLQNMQLAQARAVAAAVAVQQGGQPGAPNQGHYEDQLLQGFDPYNPPLDNVQVQSILHPYYM